jgi:rSAM/selenodomain-associated transferase 2
LKFGAIIPTLDEEVLLPRRLDEVLPQFDLVVVSDGGSRDRTVAIAQQRGAVVAEGSPGRGPQLNRGARLAIESGCEALLFLHADTELPEKARATIEGCLAAGVAGGGCLIRIEETGGLLGLAPRLVNRRTRRKQIPLGDQAQFVTAEAFDRVQGFADWPILEDYDFIRRLKRVGRLTIPEVFVTPSSRRFEQRGVIRTVVTNWLIWTLFAVGVRPESLARLYRHVR